MTRFLSHLCLSPNAEGLLEPYAEDIPEPVAGEPGSAERGNRSLPGGVLATVGAR